jgi:hypothetical protein
MISLFKSTIPAFFALVLIASCAGTQNNYQTQKKYSSQQLLQDLEIAWNTLKENHPSYDLYTPTDSIDAYFSRVKASISDSLTEAEFRLRLSYAVAAIRCGHTSVSASKAYTKYAQNYKGPQFPLYLKVWGKDSMVAIQSFSRDSLPIKRGTIITAIDSIPPAVFIQQMKQYISTDGFSEGFKEIQISSSFPARFKWMYGLSKQYKISFIDSLSKPQTLVVYVADSSKSDSLKRVKNTVKKKPAKPKKEDAKYGHFKITGETGTAILQLNNFSHPKVPSLIRKSFKQVSKNEVKNLVLDLRMNGGGRIDNSTLLTRYIIDKPFTVADSVSAKNLKLAYPSHTEHAWMFRYFRWAFAKKMEDGRWHMRQTEKQIHNPKKKHHFSGNLYVITSGLTFSASTLFLSKVHDQPNVTIVGEESGGGARGNSAVFTPRVTLPNTKVRLRLPVFRIVSDATIPITGRGFLPDVEVKPDSRSIELGKDKKMEKVLEIISSPTIKK